MGSSVQSLVQHFTDKAAVSECSIDELQQLIKRYPYFAPARFALLKKLQVDGNDATYREQYQRAILFHADPLQFTHFINEFEQQFEISTNNNPIHVDSDIVNREDEQIAEDAPQPITVGIDNIQTEEQTVEAEAGEKDPETTSALPASEDETPGESEALNVEAALNTSLIPHEQKEAEGLGTELAFEPYHTVDYFASQGIKVTADDFGKDKFGKQLRSFTEWLKTMKRIPASAAPVVASVAEQKVESLAGASVSKAEVLTESMAEVWAKQGATEKAAEIYQKLSLLNPDKAAYFAAKIQSLKQPT